MKQSFFLFLLVILFTGTASSQVFKKDDIVEVDLLLSDSLEGKWQRAAVLDVDTVTKIYTIKLSDGDKKATIPAGNPEKWIRPVIGGNGLNQYGQGVRFPYMARNKALNSFRCNGSENGIKKNIRAKLAEEFKDYQFIAVDFTSFKGQNGYDDTKFKGQQVYPYKIEMLVHLKRTIYVRGRAFIEYQTWEYDREYNYATRPGKKCEFYPVTGSAGKLLYTGWY
jgi:hypothetical protein